jgi:hypothetical protein
VAQLRERTLVRPWHGVCFGGLAMKRLPYAAFLSLPLVAAGCTGGERATTGKCPAGETCSDLTPRGLQFIGTSIAGDLFQTAPRPTAIGGTQSIALEYDRGDGVLALDLPFTADDDGGNGVRVDSVSGSHVIVRGSGSRSNYLRILDEDGLLMDRKEVTGAALSRIELFTPDFENVPDDHQIAFAAGTRDIGVALYGDVQYPSGPRSERLIDTSMDLALAGATRKAWDLLGAELTTGTHTLTVAAGDKPAASLDVVVVEEGEILAEIGMPTTIAPNGVQQVCFAALAGSRYVAGLTWTYVIDDEAPIVKGEGSWTRNCIDVTTQKTSGTVTVHAQTGNLSMSVSLAVTASARESAPVARTVSHAITTAGDRASM